MSRGLRNYIVILSIVTFLVFLAAGLHGVVTVRP